MGRNRFFPQNVTDSDQLEFFSKIFLHITVDVTSLPKLLVYSLGTSGFIYLIIRILYEVQHNNL